MSEYKGIEYLKKKLSNRRARVLLRYQFYEMKDWNTDRGITIPASLKRQYRATLGWCSKAVDSLADRLVFRTFGNDTYGMNEIYAMNNPDVIFDSAISSALISSCCFIYILAGEDGFPRLKIIDGSNATGEIDPTTGLLTEGYAALKRNNNGKILLEAYFIAGATEFRDHVKNKKWTVNNPAPYPLLVPIIHRPDAKRPFGHSRISRACMYFQGAAKRTLERSEISSEFYSFPQKYILGLDPDAEQVEKWNATITSMLQLDKDEQGGSPTVGQFPQQSMEPHIAHYKAIASSFAGETGLTLDDMGFATENPASSEAIKAAHETLRLTARKAQRTFGSGFLNAGYLAACVRDNYAYRRNQVYLTTPKWNPIFEPDFAALSGAGDGLIKIQQAFPDYLDEDKIQDLLGL